ncbi:hypothetical protein [uncultured Acetatifactor sp.]|uniref:hypothetical protein n=1 Tax=uncultured Acetatifactor sp. TaxID=1671927 RepID=UPI00262450F6|nr:hypothetical protein [uncultured Acetatifactor sp.]
MMAGEQRAVTIRFNMGDRTDRELYRKLAEGAGDAVSLTAYMKRALEEHFALNIRIADRQEFHDQMLAAVREEMQVQGMKLVGALLAGIGVVGAPGPRAGSAADGLELPEACGELPEDLQGILDYIG